MRRLHIDIETRCEINLTKCGVYKYASHESFKILWFAFSYDYGPVILIDLYKRQLPEEIKKDLQNPAIIKVAHNAQFEITCLSAYLGVELDVTQWECTMVKATMCGLPGSLDKLSEVLNLSQKKDKKGFLFIQMFSIKQKENLRKGVVLKAAHWINPEDKPNEYYEFGQYCLQDVRAEKEIENKLSWFNITETEKQVWHLDQIINRRGVLINKKFAEAAIDIHEKYMLLLTKKQKELTNLLNPKSPKQLKNWVEKQINYELEDFNKLTVTNLLKTNVSDTVKQVLSLRKEMSKTSVKKYNAMINGLCNDDRLRGLLQYYGANRTGRWAGRFVQVQNLPKPPNKKVLPDPMLPVDLTLKGKARLLELVFGNVSNMLSWLIRTAFVAPKGKRFIITDFRAIEARVIAWLAGEKWRLEVFAIDGDIYVYSYASMFKIAIEEVTDSQRQQGKVAELALGFQGGPDALKRMDYNKAINEDRYQMIVDAWRAASPKIKQMWYDVQNAAMECIESGTAIKLPNGIAFTYKKKALLITLLSGRSLVYINAHIRIIDTKFGPKKQIFYLGINQETKKLEYISTYGGKLVENIVQGTARDLLAEKMLLVTKHGYDIVMHVHDEIVCEVQNGFGSIEEINMLMSKPVEWAKGLPLSAASFETTYYYKD